MLVREFTNQDFQTIADIYNESVAQGKSTMDCRFYSADDICKLTKKFGNRETILIAQQDNYTLGWGIIKRYSDRPGYRVCCETSIYLRLSKTGKGYGNKLQDALLKQVVNFGYHHVVAKILAINQGSIAFHKRFGFQVVGTQKEIGYLQGRWHDVVIMQLILSDVPPYTNSQK